jgi:hypothetical protein
MAPGSSCSSSCSPKKPASVEAAAGADCGGPAGVVAQVDSPPVTREVRQRSGLPGPAFNRSLGRAASGGNMPFSWSDPFPTVNSPNDPSYGFIGLLSYGAGRLAPGGPHDPSRHRSRQSG